MKERYLGGPPVVHGASNEEHWSTINNNLWMFFCVFHFALPENEPWDFSALLQVHLYIICSPFRIPYICQRILCLVSCLCEWQVWLIHILHVELNGKHTLNFIRYEASTFIPSTQFCMFNMLQMDFFGALCRFGWE